MATYEFIIPGNPVARAEGVFRNRIYDKRKKEKAIIKKCLRTQFSGEPLTGSLRLSARFYTKNISVSRPDLSNYFKLYEDCLTGIVIEDDRFIVEYGLSFKEKARLMLPQTVLILDTL